LLAAGQIGIGIVATFMAYAISLKLQFGLNDLHIVPYFSSVLCQASLLALWAATTGVVLWKRIAGLVVGSAYIEGLLRLNLDEFVGCATLTVLMSTGLLLAMPVLGIRIVRRIVVDPPQAQASTGLKFSIRSLMVFTVFIALLSAGARALQGLPGDSSLIVVVWALCIVAIGLATLWAGLGEAQPMRFCPFLFGFALVLGVFFAFAVGASRADWVYILLTDLLYTVAVLGSLLVLRSCGYRIMGRLMQSPNAAVDPQREDQLAMVSSESVNVSSLAPQSNRLGPVLIVVGTLALNGVAPLYAQESALGNGMIVRSAPSYHRGGPERLGEFRGFHLPEQPVVAWKLENGAGFGDPIVVDGVILICDDAGAFWGIKSEDGEVLWHLEHVAPRTSEAMAVDGDRVFISSDDGLTALSLKTNQVIWRYAISGGAGESSPLVLDGTVFVAGYDGFVHAVDIAAGRVKWKRDIVADAPEPPPGFDPKRAVVGGNAARPRTIASDGAGLFVPIFDQSRVVALELRTGEKRWSFAAKGWIYGEPAVTEDSVLIGSQDDQLYCVEKLTGESRWNCKTKARIECGAAVRDGAVYFASCDGFLYSANAKTGRRNWAFETLKRSDGKHYAIYSAPLAATDAVCFGSFDGYLYAVHSASGELKWKIEPVETGEIASSPCTDGHRVFVVVRSADRRNGTTTLVAIGERNAPKP
jgi:outer membrane protein assembly factor BamB